MAGLSQRGPEQGSLEAPMPYQQQTPALISLYTGLQPWGLPFASKPPPGIFDFIKNK